MAWTQAGSLKGPKGDTGDTGPQGSQGIQGAAGAGINISGSVATYGDLPGGLGSGDAGKAWEVLADGKLYVWSGSTFPANGSGNQFEGPQGPQGIQGATGSTGATGSQGIQGATGAQGATGSTGSTGSTGPRGSNWYTGSGVPGTLAGQTVGDMYLDTATGNYYQLS